MDRRAVGQPQRINHVVQEIHTLAQCIQQDKLGLRAEDRKRHTREARARAHVHHAPAFRHERRERGTVQKMARNDLGRVGDCGQVHNLVLLEQHCGKFHQIIHSLWRKPRRRHLQAGFQQLIIGHPCPPFQRVSI